MDLSENILNLMNERQKNFNKALLSEMEKCLKRKEKELQDKVYCLLSTGHKPYQIVNILSLINNL